VYFFFSESSALCFYLIDISQRISDIKTAQEFQEKESCQLMPNCCKIKCLFYGSANGLISVPVLGIPTSPSCGSGYLVLLSADAQSVLVMRLVIVREGITRCSHP